MYGWLKNVPELVVVWCVCTTKQSVVDEERKPYVPVRFTFPAATTGSSRKNIVKIIFKERCGVLLVRSYWSNRLLHPIILIDTCSYLLQ